MIAYHGTVAGGLDTLKPFANPQSNLFYSCVYLSTCKALAAIYIWKHPFKWMTFEIPEDGIPLYNESFPGGLAHFYGGVKGYIYTCRGDFQTDENTTIRHAVVSRQPVRVEAAEGVEDAYAYILRCEREGLLRIHHFEDLSAEQRNRDRKMILGAIRRLDLLKGEHPLSAFVSQTFPELWEEARKESCEESCEGGCEESWQTP